MKRFHNADLEERKGRLTAILFCCGKERNNARRQWGKG